MSELLQFFTYEHLRDEKAKALSRPICEAAIALDGMSAEQLAAEVALLKASQAAAMLTTLIGEVDRASPCNVEATWAVVKIGSAATLLTQGAGMDTVLRALLEAKDCAVRSALFKH